MSKNLFITRFLPRGLLQPATDANYTVDMYEEDSQCPRDVLLSRSREADALLVQGTDVIDAQLLDLATRLKVIACCSVGYDNVDIEAAKSRGIIVCNAPSKDLIATTAESAVALLLSVAKRITRLHVGQLEGKLPPFSISQTMGLPIRDRTCGIIGMGRIGGAIARIMKCGFGNSILYFNRSAKTELEHALGAQRRALDELVTESDFVFVVLPLTDSTRNLLNRRNLGFLKRDAIVINIARSGVIDDDALVRLLTEDRIFGAGLDVYGDALEKCDHPNLVLTAHMANAEKQAAEATVEMAISNIVAVLSNGPPISPVTT